MNEVHEFQLDNGLRALLVERHSLPVVASMIWYGVGSRDEGIGETGVSHFLEHMMFKGTDRFAKGQIDLSTAKLGGSNNAFTDSDVTAYFFSLASDRWQLALEIEANRMTQCLLDEHEFAAEKNVVLEELAMGEDDPWRVLHQTAEGLAYQVHPYHHPVIGWREDLENLTVQQMRSYYQRHYGPNRAVLVAVGDLDPAHTKQKIIELFGRLPATAVPRGRVLAEQRQQGERRAQIAFPGQVTRLAMALKTCVLGEADDFVLDIASTVLSAGKTSRLYRRLVHEEQIATSVSATNEVRREPGVFWLSAELVEGGDPAKAERMIREEIELLMSKGPKPAELTRARTLLRAGFQFERETVLDMAMRLGRFETLAKQGWRLVDSVLQTYERVSAKDVMATMQRYFVPEAWNVVWSLPKDQVADDAKPRGKAKRGKPKASKRRRAK